MNDTKSVNNCIEFKDHTSRILDKTLKYPRNYKKKKKTKKILIQLNNTAKLNLLFSLSMHRSTSFKYTQIPKPKSFTNLVRSKETKNEEQKMKTIWSSIIFPIAKILRTTIDSRIKNAFCPTMLSSSSSTPSIRTSNKLKRS